MLALQTDNRRAFELVVNAVGAIGRYKRSRDRRTLEDALADLNEARRQDERYLFVPYYMAVIEDLLGRSRDAAERLQTILSHVGTSYPGLTNEMRFNLAVAQYHGYSHEHLAAAANTLEEVLRDSSSLRRRVKYFRLRVHTFALLGQIHAMWSIPKSPENVFSNDVEKDRIVARFRSATSYAAKVLYSPSLFLLAVINWNVLQEIRAIAYNARAMAIMYYSDFFLSRPRKMAKLWGAMRDLLRSEALFPRDWANYCDIGSCHLRLGYWGQERVEFEKARQYLNTVVEELRPEYGFALYEIGRSYRIERQFEKAIAYLERAMAVDPRVREVSERRIKRELELARALNAEYP